MRVTIPIFDRRMASGVTCVTLGLGPDTKRREGKNPRKAEAKLLEDLQTFLRKVPASRLAQVEPVAGTKLLRLRLQLNLAGAERRKIAGRYPLILEPRWTTATEKRVFVYHPDRQEEVVAVLSDESLEGQLRVYFQKVWADLDDEDLYALESRGKEQIRLLSLTCTPRSVMEDLPGDEEVMRGGGRGDPARKSHGRKGPRVLPDLGVDLTERVSRGDLRTGADRPALRESLASLFARDHVASVVLVGPPQGGKTTLIHQLVAELLRVDGYETHHDLDRVRHVWRISGRRLIAGMSRMGAWEKRCVDLIEDGRRRVLLFIDDLGAWGWIGRSRESDRAMADVFRPAMASRDIVVVGACTPDQMRVLEQEAPSFASALSPFWVPAATREETLRLMVREMRELESDHNVVFEPRAVQALLELSDTLLSHQALPGKALDLQRELARTCAGSASQPGAIGPKDALRLISKRTGVPELLLGEDASLEVREVQQAFEGQVMGQAEAVRAVADIVVRVKTRMVDSSRPYGVYLFTGPTGVGKTELAKALAAYLYGSEARLLRFDMAEFGGWDAAARLTGDRYRSDGVLTRRVREQPFSLVLFDEIEKAHPLVHNLLLQIFEDGRLTDASGQTAYFRHTVVVMTSNLGARARAPIGYAESKGAWMREIDAAVRSFFPPELFNRMDRIVAFEPLEEGAAARIASKELARLCRRRGLADRNVFLQVAEEVAPWVAREGFTPQDGARSIKRALEVRVGGMLTEVLSREAPAQMQLLSMRVADGELRLDRQVLREAPALAVNWVLLPLLELPRAALVDRLDHLGRRVQLLASSDELVSLSERLFSDLRALNLGDASRADSVYDLDAMRASLNAYLEELEGIVRAEGDDAERYERLEAERFGWVTRVAPYAGIRRHRLFDRRAVAWSGKRVGAEELLSRIAEGYELLRSVALVDDPRQHSVVVELSRVGELSEKRRFEGRSPGLLEELVGAYLAEAGGHSSWVMTLRDGSEVRGRGAQDRGLERVVEADRFEMSVVRPCALDTFALETGVHVWHRPRGPELVAVRVRSALDEAVVGGEGKGELPPVVRTLRFEPPVRASALAPMEVEDFAMAFAEAFPARRLRDALEPLWLMRRAGWDGGTQ